MGTIKGLNRDGLLWLHWEFYDPMKLKETMANPSKPLTDEMRNKMTKEIQRIESKILKKYDL